MPLTTRTIQSLVKAEQPGMWAHERGLYLVIALSGSATWVLRYSTKDGKRRVMTLEPYSAIDAAKLKSLELDALAYRKTIKAGGDPLAERKATIVASVEAAKPRGDTFEEIARNYISHHAPNWKNPKHKQQWENTLIRYVYPIIGTKLPYEITTDDLLRVLQQPHERNGKSAPLWTGARETASRVRSRLEIIIGAAKAKGISAPDTREHWSNHQNPAQWKDNLSHWLNGKQTKEHFKAMDWKDVPSFIAQLTPKPDYSARALALTILCATRTSETLNAKWAEFDLDAATWTIPAERMKAGKIHRVPLSAQAVELLKQVHRIDGNPFAFPGAKSGCALSNMAMLEMLRGMKGDGLTVHGFRSAFRDWITETTLHPDTIAEQALAHTIDNKTERAYRRGDAFERRKALMQQWADYLTLDPQGYRQTWTKFIA